MLNPLEQKKLLSQLQSELPDVELDTSSGGREHYGRDWSRFYEPCPLAVAFPNSLEQVQQIVQFAVAVGLPIVPSGGRTGLSGGAAATAGELVISMERMRRVLELDPVDATLRVEAGVITAQAQEHARQAGWYFPVSFAAEGSAQIGGNIATNAGGVKVVRYGLTRDWIAGLKVVTGSGDLLSLDQNLVKNASGYDLRHLFIGSEGTLGLIVEATLKLTRPPPEQAVMVLALSELEAVMPLFAACRHQLSLSAFEFFSDLALQKVCRQQDLQPPLDEPADYYALLEFDCVGEAGQNNGLRVFEDALNEGWVVDGVLSQSQTQAQELWRYREGISEALSQHTPYKNDLSVRVSQVPAFLRRLDAVVAEQYPDFEVVWFGHIGDGNLHMNVLKPPAMTVEEFKLACEKVNRLVFTSVIEFGGSISAEHGVGLLKQPYLQQVKSAYELDCYRGLKKVFDPHGILNPGKLL